MHKCLTSWKVGLLPVWACRKHSVSLRENSAQVSYKFSQIQYSDALQRLVLHFPFPESSCISQFKYATYVPGNVPSQVSHAVRTDQYGRDLIATYRVTEFHFPTTKCVFQQILKKNTLLWHRHGFQILGLQNYLTSWHVLYKQNKV
jgi:hypothetical protein